MYYPERTAPRREVKATSPIIMSGGWTIECFRRTRVIIRKENKEDQMGSDRYSATSTYTHYLSEYIYIYIIS